LGRGPTIEKKARGGTSKGTPLRRATGEMGENQCRGKEPARIVLIRGLSGKRQVVSSTREVQAGREHTKGYNRNGKVVEKDAGWRSKKTHRVNKPIDRGSQSKKEKRRKRSSLGRKT